MTKKAMSRRMFLKYGSYLSATSKFLLTGTAGFLHLASASAANSNAMDNIDFKLLLHIVKTMYPHDKLDDIHYHGVVVKLLEESASDENTHKTIQSGIFSLNDFVAKNMFKSTWSDLPPEEQVEALEKISETEFVSKLKQTTITTLYDNHQVWEIFGYEGEAFSQGGYLFRGFDDLDWLPQPPPEVSPKAEG